jgi:hypothetical protein
MFWEWGSVEIPRLRFLLNALNGALRNMARDSTGRLNDFNDWDGQRY